MTEKKLTFSKPNVGELCAVQFCNFENERLLVLANDINDHNSDKFSEIDIVMN